MKVEVEIEKEEMVSEWKIDGYIAPTTLHCTRHTSKGVTESETIESGL